jgi:hypothetical protein
MQCVTDVKICDISKGGAQLQMQSNIFLPETFSLLIVSEKLLYPAVARWRKSNRTGIEFVGESRPSALRGAIYSSPLPRN